MIGQKKSFLFLPVVAMALLVVFLKGLIAFNKRTSQPHSLFPNIIIISLDGLRPDHLGCYGYGRGISPNIDKLARESIVFENAFSQPPLPLISYLCLLTSRYPDFFPVTQSSAKKAIHSFKNKSLAHVLDNAGYLTAMFNAAAVPLSKENIQSLGFEEVLYSRKDNQRLFSQLHHLILKHNNESLFLMVCPQALNPPYYCNSYTYRRLQRYPHYIKKELILGDKLLDGLASGLNSFDALDDDERSRLLLLRLLKGCPKQFKHKAALLRLPLKRWRKRIIITSN